jgi:Tat protein translocase TatB subunit
VFNVGPAELMLILVVALLILGPQKLPDAARQLGKAMSEFRRVTSGLQDEMRGVLDEHFESVDHPPLGSLSGADHADGDGASTQPSSPPPPLLE